MVHLYTNYKINRLKKIKTTIQNHQKSSKIKHFTNSFIKIPISHPISQNPTKINTFTHSTPKSQPLIQTTFFLYKYKILIKIHIFTDYQLFTKFTYKSTSNFSYLTSKIIILYNNQPNIPYLQSLD